MTKLFVLGSANAIPTTERENTYFFLENGERSILIDCGAGAFLKLQQSRFPMESVSDIIITHFHPDHVSGLPLLVMDWWLLGRKAPLTFHGLGYTLDRIKILLELYNQSNWPDFFPVNFHEIPEEYSLVLADDQVKIHSMGVKHLIPTVGLRFSLNGKIITYSCDSEPCDGVIQLGKEADVFIHESAGDAVGHSTAYQSGVDAHKAGAKKLYLIHYPDDTDKDKLIADAKREFSGEVVLARDMMVFE